MRKRYAAGGLSTLDDEDATTDEQPAEVLDPEGDEQQGNEQPASAITAAGGLTALDIPGAAEALKLMAKSSEQARQALQQARQTILARKYNRAIPLLAASAALGAPTRAGSTAESFGAMAGALTGPLREKQAFEQANQKELLGIDTSLAGLDERQAQAQLSLAALRAKLASDAAKTGNDRFVRPDGTLGWASHAEARKPGVVAWAPAGAQTNVNMNTDKEFFGTLREGAGKMYTSQFEAATKAPEELQRNARIRSLLKQGAYTGIGADWKKNFDRVLSAAGIDFGGDKIANTEQLASELAAGTLSLIKPSGLGGGSGFSNTDREFVEKVAAGTITLSQETLERMTILHDRAQRNVMKTWNASYGRLTKSKGAAEKLAEIGYVPLELPAEEGDDEQDAAEPSTVPSAEVPSADVAAAKEPGTISFYDLPKR
jgi:hypothetical protein